MTGQSLRKFINKRKHGLVGHLFSVSDTVVEEEPIPPTVNQVLNKYSKVFSTPKELPPTRQHDHTIPFIPLAKPTNQRPYRVPYAQKVVIEKLVTEMLANGTIQPSQSPFSSLILLVKKKDGDWRFCVDCRKLNEMTVKNKFLILVIEELVDEQYGAVIFSKLDLRAGYPIKSKFILVTHTRLLARLIMVILSFW